MAFWLRSVRAWRGPALVAFALSANASAQEGKASTAEDLYRRGLSAFEAGNYAEACPTLAESYQLDPLPGALFTVATCELKAGKIASAFRRFGEFIALVDSLAPAQQAQQQTRRSVAEQQRRDLSVDLPYIRIALQGQSSSAPDVYLNGSLLAPESIGIELAVDPGEQVIEQRRNGRAVRTQRIVIAKGERKGVTVALVDDSPVVRRVPAVSGPAPATASHALAYSVAGVGVAGLAAGTVAGLLAVQEKGIVNDECIGTVCSVKGKNAADSGKTYGLVSSIGFGVGITGVAVGLWLLLLPSRSPASASSSRMPVVSVMPQKVVISGAF